MRDSPDKPTPHLRVRHLGRPPIIRVLLSLCLLVGCSRPERVRAGQSARASSGTEQLQTTVQHRTPPDPAWTPCIEGDGDCPLPVMLKAFKRCGAVNVDSRFVGRYAVDASRSFQGPAFDRPDADAKKKEMAAWFVKRMTDQYSNFVVETDRIRSGIHQIQEFCFIDVRSETGRTFDAVAVWHEDVGDPGDASLIRVRFERDGSEATFHSYAEADDLKSRPVFLRVVP